MTTPSDPAGSERVPATPPEPTTPTPPERPGSGRENEPEGGEGPSEASVDPAAAPLSRLHWTTPVYAAANLARHFLAPGVLAAGFGGYELVVALLAAQLAFQVVAWWRLTYGFDDEVLRIESGVVSRSQELIPARRIQQVNVVQKLRHRVLGLAELRVETAGGGAGGRTSLEVVTVERAHELRDALLAAKARARPVPSGPAPEAAAPGDDVPADGDVAAPAWVPAPWTLVALSHRQLVVAGLTGAQLLVFFAVVSSLLPFVDDLPGSVTRRLGGIETDVGVIGFAVLAVLFVVLWLGSAAASSVLRDGGYELSLVGDELHVSRGLLDRNQGALPLGRIQAVRVTASPIRRALGLVTVRFQSAGRGTDADESRVDVPVLPVDELERVLSLVLPGSVPVPPLRSPPLAARRRAVVRRLVPVAVVAIPIGVSARPWGSVAALVAVALCVPWGIAAYRALGHAVTDRFLYARNGAFLRRTVVVPTERAQSAAVASSLFQRRVGLGTLSVHLAGPGADPYVLDEDEAVVEDVLRRVMADSGRAVRRR